MFSEMNRKKPTKCWTCPPLCPRSCIYEEASWRSGNAGTGTNSRLRLGMRWNGIHGADAVAGMDLVKMKREYGQALVLIGNVDVRVLFGSDLEAVRGEVDRCIAQGK